VTAASNPRLLVVDDEPDLRTLYELTLLREGYDVESAGSVTEGWALLQERGPGGFQLLITDMRLPDGTGLDLLRRLDEAGRPERAVVITAYGSPENAVEALKAGAYDYLTKPVDLRQFRAVVASALGRVPAATAGRVAAPTNAPRRPALQRLLGDSTAMQQVRSLVDKVGRSMAPVQVYGESGTGKELVARAIHDCSARASGPFIAVNCGAIPENLLEAEFFGYRKGAFTGANEDRDGFFQAAQSGTLFLDEIGDLPLAMQSKLLRVIQERAVRPLGATTEQPVNVRIVSATHKDLGSEVQAGRFRQDLYYRLNVIRIVVPPLRERLGDVRGRAAPAELCLPWQRARTRESAASRTGAGRGAVDRRRGYRPARHRLRRCWHRSRRPWGERAREPCAAFGAASAAANGGRADQQRPAAVARRLGGLPRRGRAPGAAARTRAPPLQPHRSGGGPGPVAAPNALSHGAAGHWR
jgi:two-component system response regulator PilR (NtrC family)